MATSIVSVSFSNGFIGSATKTNESSFSDYLTTLGWSNFQFQQATTTGLFGGSQGNDLSGTILVTDAAGVQHHIDGVINWRAPSGSVSTMVFYATGSTNHTLATVGGGTKIIDPNTEANGDPHSFIGLTFNGQSLAISSGKVSGNAATSGLLDSLNEYLAAQPQLSVGDVTVDEAAGTATVTVSLSKATPDTVMVKYSTQDGTALAGTDYTAGAGTLTFAPNETSKTIQVPLLDNATVDGARNVSIVLSDSTFAAITDNVGVVTISDNDSGAVVTSVLAEDSAHVGQSPTDSTVTEGATLVYSVALSGTAGGEYTLAISGSATTADVGTIVFSDGVAWLNGNPASAMVFVPAGVGSFRVTVPTIDDTGIESAETVVVTAGGVSSTGTVTDNDSQSVTSVVAEDAAHTGADPVDSTVAEGGALRYTVTLNSASPAASEYALTLGGTAASADLAPLSFSAGVTWKDGDAASGIIVVPAGVVSFYASLATIDDAAIESAETAVLTVGGVSITGTITDSDSQAVASVVAEDAAHAGQSPADSTVEEGGSLLYNVILNTASPTPTEFALALSGTATAADRSAMVFTDGVAWKDADQASGIIVVPAGLSSFTVTVATVDDAIIENAESVVLTVDGVAGTGTISDNDVAPPAPTPTPIPTPVPVPAPTPAPPKPVPVPAPPAQPALETGLDPDSDDGSSNSDTVTSVRDPEFKLKGSGMLVDGGSVRLLSPGGEVVGTRTVTAADVLSGAVKVGPGPLDDGVYTFTAQILNASGAVIGQAPVSVTIVTDLDGVAPSVELAAHNGDYNGDGILDWQQNSVAHMPLASLADFALGKAAPLSSFGAVIAGSIGSELETVRLTAGAQLKDLSLTGLPAALPDAFRAASPVFNFTIGPEDDVAALPDLAPERAGLQTRVVIDLGVSGVVSNDFVKFDQATQTWYSFLDDQDLTTMDDGATLVDLNSDGRVDRIVLTLTDGARGDDDGMVNGVIVDPGLLAFDVTPPDQVYNIRLANGEVYYTDNLADAQVKAAGAGNVFAGVAFDSMRGDPGAKHVSSFYQPFTKDMTFAIDGDAMPYACYELIAGSAGFMAAVAGSAAVDIHLYQNGRGLTELLSAAEAQRLGLATQGYTDRGAKFSVSVDNAFNFDAEGYLIANHDNAAVKALVGQLAAMYQSTSQAGFIEAVEQSYFAQVQLVGVAHGAAATAGDVNAVFGTTFGN